MATGGEVRLREGLSLGERFRSSGPLAQRH